MLAEFKEPGRSVRAAYDENLARLPRHDPAAVLAERVRDPLERVGGARSARRSRRGSTSASGSGSTPRATRGRRRARDGDPRARASRRACSTSSRTSSPTSSGRAGSSSRSPGTTSTSASTRRSRRSSGSARPARSGSASSGTRRAPARASRCCGSRRRCCAAMPGSWTFVMVTDRTELDDQLHGDVRRRRRGQPRGARPRRRLARTCASCSRADHRYVFTLIHKFRLREGEAEMPVLLGARRRDRDHRRGAPQPVRHARAEHARRRCRTPRSWASPARR